MPSKVIVSSFSASVILAWCLSQAESAIGQPAVKLKPGTIKRVEVADDVFMEFCFIPPGEAKLGSITDEERKEVLAAWKEEHAETWLKPKFLDLEAAEKRGVFKSAKGFWLGKYEVTQEEWKAVMGGNPSFFRPAGTRDDIGRLEVGRQIAALKNPSRLPVECIQPSDCEKFLERINKRLDLAKVFGNGAKFVLPHENEWEYAYRGGKGNDRPFYWGKELNGTQANCNGAFPFGTDKKGQCLHRPCEVDDTNKGQYEAHPWGLVHMSGNVAEWCENKDASGHRMLCGGSWASSAWDCRAASRDNGQHLGADLAGMSHGIRVCVRFE